MKKKYYTDVRI